MWIMASNVGACVLFIWIHCDWISVGGLQADLNQHVFSPYLDLDPNTDQSHLKAM